MPNVGGIIRSLRRERGLTQRELAAYAGIDQSYLSKIEKGQIGSVGVEIAGLLAHALGVSLDEMLEAAEVTPAGKTIREVVREEHGLNLDRLAALAADDESVRRLLIALPEVPGYDREMLAVFVEAMRDRYRRGRPASPEATG